MTQCLEDNMSLNVGNKNDVRISLGMRKGSVFSYHTKRVIFVHDFLSHQNRFAFN